MKTNESWKPNEKLRVLAWGRSKVGKTWGSGTFPRPCIMDFDRGMATLFSPDFIAAHGKREFIWESFYERSFKGSVVTAHNGFDDACKFFDDMMLPDNRDRFDTWVIDSGTTLAELAMNKAIILLGTKAYNEMSKTHEKALRHGLVLPRIQDFGAERSLVEQFIDQVLSSDKHVVLIAHEREQTDSEGSVIAVVPNFTGKSSETVPLRFDEVYYIQAIRRGLDWSRVCITQPDGLHKVGSRNGVPDKTPWNYDEVSKAMAKARLLEAEAVERMQSLKSVQSNTQTPLEAAKGAA